MIETSFGLSFLELSFGTNLSPEPLRFSLIGNQRNDKSTGGLLIS